MIERKEYLKKVLTFKDQPLIKIITGIRRCGKSELMKQIAGQLHKDGANENNLVYINFESFRWANLKDAKSLYSYVEEKLEASDKSKSLYLLLDEILEVDEWEKAINSLLAEGKADIYITGSNSRLLSSDLSTYLTGRYVEIGMSTLSFAEYLKFHGSDINTAKQSELYEAFNRYLRRGGFPVVNIADYDDETAYSIVSDIYSSIILRDTVQRFSIRNVKMLGRIARYMLNNAGSPLKAKNISDYFKSQMRKADIETIYNYMSALESSFAIQRVPRYNVKGREILRTNDKWYAADPSLVYAVIGYRPDMIGAMFENIVFLELHRHDYSVYVGTVGEYEIDFVAERKDEKLYVQVCFRIDSESTLERECRSLKLVNDNYPKYIVTMDALFNGNIDGIIILHVADFLKRI